MGLSLQKAAGSGGIVVAHAEDDDLLQFNHETFTASGRG
jgi:hypothetical protein